MNKLYKNKKNEIFYESAKFFSKDEGYYDEESNDGQ